LHCVLEAKLTWDLVGKQRGRPPPADRYSDLPGYHVLSMSGSTRPRTPGNTRAARQDAARIVACRRNKPVGTPDAKIFGAQHLQGRHHPLSLHLACFRDYAPMRLLPATPQGSILGSRRTITQAGFPPARTRNLARPHCPLFPSHTTRIEHICFGLILTQIKAPTCCGWWV